MKKPLFTTLAGLTAGGAGIGASEAVAAMLTGVTSPTLAVANRVIDWTPRPLKEFAIEQFGEADKPILLGSVIAGMVLFIAVLGFLGAKRPKVAFVGFGVLVAVAAVTVLFDRVSSANFAVRLIPVVALGVVAIGALWWMLRQVGAGEAAAPEGFDRRKFLAAAGAATAVTAGGVASARTFLVKGTGRGSVRIPVPQTKAPAVPGGTVFDINGITPYITPNSEFYRVDTATQVPRVPVDGYTLRIHGMVDEEIELSFAELLRLPLVEKRLTITCVSNPVGGPFVGNATWIGVRTKDLLEMVGVKDGADAVKTTSFDGMVIGTPLEALTDDRESLIAIAMNGEPLPLDHGFPVRMVVPGLFGYVSATKWLTEIEVTRFADFKAYWTTRGYSAEAPIKTGGRIDVPKPFERVSAGKVVVAGVAWAQTRGIEKVEVRFNGGDWFEAELAEADGIQTWRQWRYEWDVADGGSVKIDMRATDGSGEVMTEERAPIAPNGATGWPSTNVRVEA